MSGVTKMENLDSTASDSFEIDMNPQDFGSAPVDVAGESKEPLPTEQDLAKQGSDWFDTDLIPQEDVKESVEDLNEEAQSLEGDNEVVEQVEENVEEAKSDDVPTVSVDVRRKQHDFKLDPEDADLRRTLRDGVRAKAIKAENDKLKEAETKWKEDADSAREAQSVFDELRTLTDEGDYDRVVQAVLGENYQKYLEDKFEDFIRYQEATPEERRALDAERANAAASYAERQKDKRIRELEDRLERRDSEGVEKEIYGYAVSAQGKHTLTSEDISDPDLRSQLNKRMWNSAWETAIALSKLGKKLSPGLWNKVFEREAKIFKSGLQHNTEAKAVDTVEKKKEVAQKQAAKIATSRHPRTTPESSFDLSEWNGKSAKDLLNKIRGYKR